ncbi:MAG: hypothetical protein EXQ79_01375 [Acidimicrobiia bacterium]|nr:hypothetical protein [Acidimicrobiia bacterium]
MNFSPKQMLGGLGALVLLVSGFVSWQDAGSLSVKGTDVPVEFLVIHKSGEGSPSVFLVLAIAAGLIGGGLLIKRRFSVFVGGALGALAAVLFTVQLQQFIDDVGEGTELFNALGIGVFLALIGGALGIVASLLPDPDADGTQPPAA